jgi:hypothetical protein
MVAAKPIFSHVRGEGCPMALRVIKYSMCASRVGGGVPSTSGVALDYIAMEVRPFLSMVRLVQAFMQELRLKYWE